MGDGCKNSVCVIFIIIATKQTERNLMATILAEVNELIPNVLQLNLDDHGSYQTLTCLK